MKLAESRKRRNDTKDCLAYIIDDLDEIKEEASVYGLGNQMEYILRRLEVLDQALRIEGLNLTWDKLPQKEG